VDLEEISRNGMFQVRVQWRNFAKATVKEAIRFTSQHFFFNCGDFLLFVALHLMMLSATAWNGWTINE
jgi:hypothetical protein